MHEFRSNVKVYHYVIVVQTTIGRHFLEESYPLLRNYIIYLPYGCVCEMKLWTESGRWLWSQTELFPTPPMVKWKSNCGPPMPTDCRGCFIQLRSRPGLIIMRTQPRVIPAPSWIPCVVWECSGTIFLAGIICFFQG